VRSRRSPSRWTLALTAFWLMLPPAPQAAAQQPHEQSHSERPGQQDIARALETLRADPQLSAERTIKMLRWKRVTPPKPSSRPAWMAWIAGLFRWLEQSARLLVWVGAALLVIVLGVWVARLVRARGERPASGIAPAPTHVRDLDIRPESLPSDIGAAARALWDRGEHRAAMALLYRGLLSRLVHVHRAPIRDSSTEGDCLTLAASHLAQARYEYASRLVGVWQRAVYGREPVPSITVHALCDGFAGALDRRTPFEGASAEGTR
jgi:hypothetical protein